MVGFVLVAYLYVYAWSDCCRSHFVAAAAVVVVVDVVPSDDDDNDKNVLFIVDYGKYGHFSLEFASYSFFQ